MRSRVLLVLGALVLTMVMPVTATAGAGDAKAAAKAEQNRIIAYWTPARIAAAQHRDYVRTGTGKIIPFAKPGGTGGGTGASWTGNEPVELRVGRILFSSGGSDWICSGTVVDDAATNNGYSIILTAGHCVYDGADGWSYNFLFMPDFDDNPNYDCAARVLGCWTANRVGIHTNFHPSGFGPDAALRVDYGFARVGAGSKGAQLDATVGGYGITTATIGNAEVQWAFGFPAEGRYKGKDLIFCTGATAPDPQLSGVYGMNCNMNGGSSGGGWLLGAANPSNDENRFLSSVNSYGYSGLAKMFGPKFTADTIAVMNSVIGSSETSLTENCNVGTTPPSGC
jgi:hypothetical protein